MLMAIYSKLPILSYSGPPLWSLLESGEYYIVIGLTVLGNGH